MDVSAPATSTASGATTAPEAVFVETAEASVVDGATARSPERPVILSECTTGPSSARHPSLESHDPRRRRREAAQRPRREAEARAQRVAVECAQDIRGRGFSAAFAARQLNIPSRTLRHWACHAPDVRPCRGRPCHTSSAADRQEVLRFVSEVSGVAVGLAALRPLFTHLPRCVLEDLLRRARKVRRQRYREAGFRLDWRQAGRVWAIDFSAATQPIDGVLPYLFPVRDLASHQQLAWLPLRGETADEACLALERLFLEHGPPLIVKSDNGSAFIAEKFGALLEKYHVTPLFSPPRRPQYNGALERSNGTLKTYTQLRAETQGHPLRWTSDDVESARQLANTVSRPWGHTGHTPDEAWQARSAITADERTKFDIEVTARRAVGGLELGLDPAAELNHFDQSRLDRVALQRALVATGNLRIERADRAPRKPQRLSRQELAARAATQFATAPPPDESALHPARDLAALRSADTHIAMLDDAATRPTDRPPKIPLATSPPSARIMADQGVPDDAHVLAKAPRPTQCERAFMSRLRRSIAPLIRGFKAAIFTWV